MYGERMKLELIFKRRKDGGLRVWSPTLHGFVLSSKNPFSLLADIKPTLEVMVPVAIQVAARRKATANA